MTKIFIAVLPTDDGRGQVGKGVDKKLWISVATELSGVSVSDLL